jgi:hypothetical protein
MGLLVLCSLLSCTLRGNVGGSGSDDKQNNNGCAGNTGESVCIPVVCFGEVRGCLVSFISLRCAAK